MVAGFGQYHNNHLYFYAKYGPMCNNSFFNDYCKYG